MGVTYTDEVIRERLEWCQLQATDVERIKRFARKHADEVVPRLIAGFYEHILKYEKTKAFFHSPEAVERVKSLQDEYFRKLMSGEYDANYFEDRRRVGLVHERIGLGAEFYIGAYDILLKDLSHHLGRYLEGDAEEVRDTYLAFQRVAHLDIAIAVDAYTEAREETIGRQQRLLSELPTPVLILQPGLLLVPVVGLLDPMRARRLTEEILEGVRAHRAKVIVIDVTGVNEVDTSVANNLVQTIRATRLMGAQSIVTGVSSLVARAIVRLGVETKELNTVGGLQQGVQKATRILAEG